MAVVGRATVGRWVGVVPPCLARAMPGSCLTQVKDIRLSSTDDRACGGNPLAGSPQPGCMHLGLPVARSLLREALRARRPLFGSCNLVPANSRRWSAVRHSASAFDSVWGRGDTPERLVGSFPSDTTAIRGGRPPMRLALDEMAFKAGSQARFLYLIESGAVRLEAPSSRWDRRVIALLGPGDVIGEECLGENRYRYDAVATDTTVLRRIDPRDQDTVDSCVGPLVRTLLRQRHDAEVRRADMQAPAMARLARCLLDLARRLGVEEEGGWITLRARLTHQLLASYIGVNRVTATKMLGELRRRRAISGGHSHFRVRVARLREIEERCVLEAL